MARRPRQPAYCLHKASGRAVVRIDGRDYYLGQHGTKESWDEYHRLMEEWRARGRLGPPEDGPSLSVAEVLLRSDQWAQDHYRDAEGNSGRELENLKLALRPVRELCGLTPAARFSATALLAVQQHLVGRGLSRRVINARVGRVKRFWKWAVSRELAPAAV